MSRFYSLKPTIITVTVSGLVNQHIPGSLKVAQSPGRRRRAAPRLALVDGNRWKTVPLLVMGLSARIHDAGRCDALSGRLGSATHRPLPRATPPTCGVRPDATVGRARRPSARCPPLAAAGYPSDRSRSRVAAGHLRSNREASLTGSGRHPSLLAVVRGAHFSPNHAGAKGFDLSPIAGPRAYCLSSNEP